MCFDLFFFAGFIKKLCSANFYLSTLFLGFASKIKMCSARVFLKILTYFLFIKLPVKIICFLTSCDIV